MSDLIGVPETRHPAHVTYWADRPGYTMVLPSASLRELVMRRLCERDVRLKDYKLDWIDAKGYGCMIAMQPQGPPKPYKPEYRPNLYRNPGYDLVNM